MPDDKQQAECVMGNKPTEVEKQAVRALHARLQADYPKAFGSSSDQPFHRLAPLRRGIHKDIMDACPDVPPATVRRFVKWYVYTPEYLMLSVAGAKRLDLIGHPDGEVTSSEAEHAQMILAKFAARRSSTTVQTAKP
jgi:sRNA-binding protein